nr:energy-coupled thiamine transporter ThiT [Veillonella sp.]
MFAEYAPKGQSPWIYSMIYNASYMVPELIINLIVILLFYERIMRGISSVTRRP